MSEIVERVSVAIDGALNWGDDGPPPHILEAMARAAIAAMREPTEAMLRGGGAWFDPNPYMGGASQRGKDKARQTFATMIDEALR